MSDVVLPTCRKLDYKVIIQCGDFGFWPGPLGKAFLDELNEQCILQNVHIFWLDGNHEWHDVLSYNECYESEHPVLIRDHIYYLPRGFIWNCNALRFMSVGGAYSVDKYSRLKNDAKRGSGRKSWWPQEELTEEDVSRSIQRLNDHNPLLDNPSRYIDVMFSHDVPLPILVPGIHAEMKSDFPEAIPNREKLSRIVQVAKPRMLIHGHYHVSYQTSAQFDNDLYTQVIGLNANPSILYNLDRTGQAIHLSTTQPYSYELLF